MKNKKIITICMIFIAFALVYFSSAVPPLSTEFYGTVTIYNINRTPLPSGQVVQLYSGNVSCGNFTTLYSGYYGVLSCLGDDPYTFDVEGAVHGQNIIFYLEGEIAQTFGDTVWYTGEYQFVNITPIPRCGNGWCELTESCWTCAEDCGLCPPNMTGNYTGGGTGGGDGSGTGSGGGSSSSSGGGGGGTGRTVLGGIGGIGYTGAEGMSMEFCQENWQCTEWQPEICPLEELRTRTCEDLNECGTEFLKPDLNQSCEYQGTCFDLIKNQDETDVDCGGDVCEPCDVGKRCLFDFDCKTGFCHPVENVCAVPSCTDGYRNQGEEGIDCGGPCPPCERPTLERPATIVHFLRVGCGPFPWQFILAASILTLIIYALGKYRITKIKQKKEYKKLKKIDQLVKAYNLDRDLNAFVWISILLEFSIALYLYYLCELAIWIFLMILFIIPLIIAIIIKRYVYDEKRKKKKLYDLLMRHENSLSKLINIEREEIKKEEKKILEKFALLDYKNADEKLVLLLKDINFLIKELQQTNESDPFEIENSLADAISGMDEYKEKIISDESLNELYNSLNLIEKIHRDIILHYKEMRENEEIKEILKQQAEEEEMRLRKNDGKSEKTRPEVIIKLNRPTAIEKDEIKKDTKVDYIKIKQDFAEAENKEEKISELLSAYNKDPVILFMIASFYHRKNNLKKAEEIYLRTIASNPRYKPALYYLASLYNQQKRMQDSYRLYKKIIHLDPGYQNAKKYYDMLKLKYEVDLKYEFKK